MDELWNVEDKLKISTQKAIVLLVCSAVLVVIVCATIVVLMLKNKAAQRNKIACHDYYSNDDDETESMIHRATSAPSSSKCGIIDVRNTLLGSPCWSVAHKWNDEDSGMVFESSSWKIWKLSKDTNKMMRFNCMQCCGCCVGRGSKLPVWQRPILMGVKCKLPRFSGLILYDERGRPLPHHHHAHRFSAVSSTYQDIARGYKNLHNAHSKGRSYIAPTTMLIDLLQ